MDRRSGGWMHRRAALAIRSGIVASLLSLSCGGLALAQNERVTEIFPVNRDVGINGYPGEEYTNTGASGFVRGAKSTQHAALFDWDTDAIIEFLDDNPGEVSVTFNIHPTGTPDTDVQIETVESLNDWVEGDGAPGCCGNFTWTPDTPAVTNEYAQTYYLPDLTVDPDESEPWLNDEDGSQYTFMNRGAGGLAIPNFVNTLPFELAVWEENEFMCVLLDNDLFEDLIDNPDNRGLRLAARGSNSNWPVAMREQAGGTLAAFLEVTVSLEGPVGAELRPGDTNGDGRLNITDPVALLNVLFGEGELPDCYTVRGSDPVMFTEAGVAVLDFNGDGGVNISDAVGALNSLFGGGGPHVLGEECVLIAGDCPPACQ